jgi:hypothetical protein
MSIDWISLVIPSALWGQRETILPIELWYSIIVRFGAFMAAILGSLVAYQGLIRAKKWQGKALSWPLAFDLSIDLLIFGAAMFLLGGYWANYNLIILLSQTITIFAFGTIGELDFLKNDLTRWREFTPGAWMAYIGALIGLIGGLGYTLWLYVITDLWPLFLIGALIVAIVWLIAAIWARPFHPHHSTILFMASLFINWDTGLANVLSGICIGVWTQGALSFGIGGNYFI